MLIQYTICILYRHENVNYCLVRADYSTLYRKNYQVITLFYDWINSLPYLR